MRTLRVLWRWPTMGPYHFARMAALSAHPAIALRVIETTDQDDHEWTRPDARRELDVVSLGTGNPCDVRHRVRARAYERELAAYRPDIVIETGYAEHDYRRVALDYARRRGTVVFWSETTRIDHPRRWLRERLKAWLIGRFDGALVAGTPHADYLRELGMPAERIAVVGGCVDNEYFGSAADAARRDPGRRPKLGLPSQYFLYVGRLIAKKNLDRLLEAYHRYRAEARAAPCDLVLVGSGAMEESLRQAVLQRGTAGVHFAGVKQVDELPAYYAFANCLILPSVSEPWGLVVNEAMAAAVPVVVSNRCGCVADLVRPDVNGFVFDPINTEQLRQLMHRLSTPDDHLRGRLGAAGRRHVAAFSPGRFAEFTVRHISRLQCERARRHRHDGDHAGQPADTVRTEDARK